MMMTKILALGLLLTTSAHAQDMNEQVNQALNQVMSFKSSNDFLIETAKIDNRLIRLGKPAVAPLAAALVNPKMDYFAKWSAAQVLGEIGDEQAIPTLIATMTDENQDEWLRGLCSYALAQIGAPSIQPLLNVLANQSQVTVASAYVARTLGRLQVRSAETAMAKIAESMLPSNGHCYALENEVIRALGQVGSAQSVALLTKLQARTEWKESATQAIQSIQAGAKVKPVLREGKIYVYSFSATCSRTDPETGVVQTIPCPGF